MAKRDEGKALLDGLYGQLKGVINGSSQGVYLYLDDHHLVCNTKFARMLGYSSPAAWKSMGRTGFLNAFVAPSSQRKVVDAFWKAMKNKTAFCETVGWKKKSGATVRLTTIMVPISYKHEMFALHFVSKA
ncbi:MAG: PAS domain-containing protein [Nanoarchaeota archaeon]